MGDQPFIEKPATLEAPSTAEELYYAIGDEAPASRPLLTGDVLTDVEIPGLNDGSGSAIILTHPCAMRRDGVVLADRIFVARVRPYQAIPLNRWTDSHFKVMPIPAPHGPLQGDFAGFFNEASLVHGDALDIAKRIICLSESGINLLQQRLVYHLTRFVVPTVRLHQVSVQVFREVELQEEWVVAATEAGADIVKAQRAFHEWLRSSDAEGQPTRQSRLHDQQQAAAVRREMRAAVKQQYSTNE